MTNIRPARSSDIQAILDFDYFDHDPAKEIGEKRILVAEAGGQISGFVSWQPKGFVGRDYITFLFVKESRRRSGIGRQLLREAYEALDCGRVFVSTESDNLTMMQLLESEDWTSAGSVSGANHDGTAEAFFYKDKAI